MINEFTREGRYIVFKISDVERYLTDKDRANITMMKMEIDAGRDCANKPPFKGLIVEADWPEYEPTWRAIEARVSGAQPAPSFADACQGAMEAMMKEGRGMTPAEATTVLRQFNNRCRGMADWSPSPDLVGEAIDAAVEMIDRLEAAEKERDALRSKIAEMERQEPVGEWLPLDSGEDTRRD